MSLFKSASLLGAQPPARLPLHPSCHKVRRMLVHTRKLRAAGLPPQNFFRSLPSKMPENCTFQNSTKILLEWGGLSSYQLSTVFQNIDFYEFSRSFYIFQEVNCIPGVVATLIMIKVLVKGFNIIKKCRNTYACAISKLRVFCSWPVAFGKIQNLVHMSRRLYILN